MYELTTEFQTKFRQDTQDFKNGRKQAHERARIGKRKWTVHSVHPDRAAKREQSIPLQIRSPFDVWGLNWELHGRGWRSEHRTEKPIKEPGHRDFWNRLRTSGLIWLWRRFAAVSFCMLFDRQPQRYFYLLNQFCSIINPDFGWLLPKPTRFSSKYWRFRHSLMRPLFWRCY